MEGAAAGENRVLELFFAAIMHFCSAQKSPPVLCFDLKRCTLPETVYRPELPFLKHCRTR